MDIITTTPNRVRQSGFWCEDATAITQAAIDTHGLTWDTETPVAAVFDMIGLANTLLCLGCVRPRFQQRADRVTVNLMRYLYRMAVRIEEQDTNVVVTNVEHWLGNPDRAQACKGQCDMWKKVGHNAANPAAKAICDALAILFSPATAEEPNHIKCVHASKLILFAIMKQDGELEAQKARQLIIDYIKEELLK